MIDVGAALPGAVERGEMSAWFQPQLDLHTGEIVGAEALCRWTHPDLGPVPPNEFIPVAEELGLIDEIGLFMADEACAAAREWAGLPRPVSVSVNVSPAQLLTDAFTNYLAVQLNRLKLPPKSLIVEITEALPISDFPVVVGRLDDLRRRGLGIALDDFGVGHSSVRQLRRIHANELKIDRSLVIDDSAESTVLLTSVISEVHSAGLTVVAEGVETEDQLQRVRDLRCDRAQGYLIGRPQPRAALELLLA
jgi:EAL domain-containing protein (putative c-di-GMP-specific phosphodiesterase class I)